MKTRIEKEKIENIVTVKRKHLCIKRVNSYFTRYTIIKKIKCLIKLIAFITILIICFVVVNNVTKRKYSYKKMADFFSQKKNFDVLFFGSSHTINGVYPMQLWNDYGIISYNMGNHSETIVTTYYNLLLALKHIKPSINDKIRMYEKSKITIYKHTFFFVYFLGRYTKMKKLITQLRILKEMNLKPNYSALAREYGCDRRTVKKYNEGYTGGGKTRNKKSKLDKYLPTIKEKLQYKGIHIKSVYEYLVDNFGKENVGTYSNFHTYIVKKKTFDK